MGSAWRLGMQEVGGPAGSWAVPSADNPTQPSTLSIHLPSYMSGLCWRQVPKYPHNRSPSIPSQATHADHMARNHYQPWQMAIACPLSLRTSCSPTCPPGPSWPLVPPNHIPPRHSRAQRSHIVEQHHPYTSPGTEAPASPAACQAAAHSTAALGSHHLAPAASCPYRH